MRKSIKTFINQCPQITLLAFVAFAVGTVVSVITNLGLAALVVGICTSVIAAFIFFVLQIYIPEIREKKIVYPNIRNRLAFIIAKMNGCFVELGKLYVPENKADGYSTEELKMMMSFNLNDKTSITKFNEIHTEEDMYNPSKRFALGEWLLQSIVVCEDEIDRVYRHYGNYISVEVGDCLERVLQSEFHAKIKFFTKSKREIDFSQANNFIGDYWDLKCELEQIVEKI